MAQRSDQILHEMTTPTAKEAMLHGFQQLVRSKLRGAAETAIASMLDEIVDAAVKEFEADISAYVMHGQAVPTLRVLLEFNKKEKK